MFPGLRTPMRDCQLPHTRYNAIEISGGTNYHLVDCRFIDCAKGAIQINTGNEYFIERCLGENLDRNGQGRAVAVGNADAVYLVSSSFLHYQYGVDFNPSGGFAYTRHYVIGCASDSGGYGAFIGHSGGTSAFGVLVKDCWLGTNGFGLASENSEGLQVIGCTVANNNSHGIRLYGTTKKALIQGCIVTGNNAGNLGGVGIALADAGLRNVIIAGNFIGPSGRFVTQHSSGIDIDAHVPTNTDLIIVNNNLRGDTFAITHPAPGATWVYNLVTFQANGPNVPDVA